MTPRPAKWSWYREAATVRCVACGKTTDTPELLSWAWSRQVDGRVITRCVRCSPIGKPDRLHEVAPVRFPERSA